MFRDAKGRILLGLCSLLSVSCGISGYEFDKNDKSIISKKKNNISHIYIKSENGSVLAEFERIGQEDSKNFSLINFSPSSFKKVSSSSFYFEKGKTYSIRVLPQGDRVLSPIQIQVDSSGNIHPTNRQVAPF